MQNMVLHRKKNKVQQQKKYLASFWQKTRCKKEAKIGANLEVKHGAKWDGKVVEKNGLNIGCEFGC